MRAARGSHMRLRDSNRRPQSICTVFECICAWLAHQLAGVLSGGEQQMLAIGRALMAQPPLLILDEPSLGLAPKIIDEIFDVMKRINQDDGVTILVAEQNAMKVLQSVERAYVLEGGKIAHQGQASDLIRDEQIKASHLGVA